MANANNLYHQVPNLSPYASSEQCNNEVSCTVNTNYFNPHELHNHYIQSIDKNHLNFIYLHRNHFLCQDFLLQDINFNFSSSQVQLELDNEGDEAFDVEISFDLLAYNFNFERELQ